MLHRGEQRHRLVFDFHHLIFDGWSVGVFLRDLATSYEDCVAGGSGELPARPGLSWGGWAVLQETQRAQQTSQRDYWRRQLADLPEQSTFPSDRPRSDRARFRGDEVERRLPESLRLGVAETARRLRVTPFVLLLSAFGVVLAARAGQRDVAIGCPMGARASSEVRHLIGYLIDMTVLRLDVDRDLTLAETVTRTRGVVLDAMSHQDVTFDQVVTDVAKPRSLAQNPLFQVLFSFEEGGDGNLALGSAEIGEVLGLPTFAAKFDVTFTTRWAPDLLELNIEYDVDLYDAATVEAIAEDYAMVLGELTEQQDRRLMDLDLPWRDATPEDQPDPAHVVTTSYEPPRTDLERRLVEVWHEVLDVDEIGVEDNFFQLGGDSLRASRLIGRTAQALAVEIPVRTLFDHPTIRAFAAQLPAESSGHHERPSRPRPRARRSTTPPE